MTGWVLCKILFCEWKQNVFIGLGLVDMVLSREDLLRF